MHQFGSQDGKIPARPFLGISGADRAEVLGYLDRFWHRPLAASENAERYIRRVKAFFSRHPIHLAGAFSKLKLTPH